MRARLAPSLLAHLLPLSKDLARRAARGDDLSDDALAILCVDAGVDPIQVPDAVDELLLWAGYLEQAWSLRGGGVGGLLEQSLMDRGFSSAQAAALIAWLDSSPLACDPPSLHLGEIAVGTAFSETISVRGPAGMVACDDNRVRVSPDRFGPGETTLTLSFSLTPESGPLDATLTFTTLCDRTEIAVTAQPGETAAPASAPAVSAPTVVGQKGGKPLTAAEKAWIDRLNAVDRSLK